MITRESASALLAKRIMSEAEFGPVLLLLSGGSAVAIGAGAYSLLSPEIQNNVMVTLTDERYGEVGHTDSNWQQLMEAGLKPSADRAIPVLTDHETTREATADAFEANLKQELEFQPFVIALLGIGTDHHTAGLLPESVALEETPRLVTSYKAAQFERITIAPAFFPLIDEAYLYAEGAPKLPAIAALNEDFPIASHPSQLIKECKKFEVLYNEEAA